MKFYEKGPGSLPRDDRVYRKTFPRQTTRYVMGELYLTFPIPDRRIDFEIDAVFYSSDGSVVARQTAGGWVTEDWGRGSGYWGFGTGSRRPLWWKAGLYRVDLSVDGKLIASEEFEIVDRQIPASGPFLELRDGLPWASHPLGLDEENALLALSSIMETDPALAAQVSSLPWMRHALTAEGSNALQALDILATANVDLAKRVAGFSWLSDGVTKDDWLSLRGLASLAEADAELAGLVAGYPWLAGAEGLSVDQLRDILRESPAALEALLGFPWLAGGMTEDEKRTVSSLLEILREAPTVAKTLLAFVWLADGVTEDERRAVNSLRGILRQDPAMAKAVLESRWFSDGVTRTDSRTIAGLRNLYDLDRSSISTLTAKPWFKDGLSDEEFMLVGDLGGIARCSEAHFLAIIGMPFLETFDPADALAARSLRQLGCWGGSKEFQRVMAHPTISDGISDEETTIVATLHDASSFNTDILGPLLDPDTVRLEERTIDLPHTGEMQLTVVRIRPGAERTMDLLEKAVRTVEGFASMPFPVRHVIFLAENTNPNHVSIDFTNMSGEREWFDTDERPAVDALHVLAHETSHYYWFREWSRHWVEDGLGAFFQSLVIRQVEIGPGVPVVPIWRPHMPPCPYMSNIAGRDRELDTPGIRIISDCSDSFGERLFQDLWRTLGDSVFRQGLANLHLLARSGAPVGECKFKKYDKVGICEVAAAFKAAAPADAAATVDKVVGRWYDNSEPYDLSNVDTSPPNPNLPNGVDITRAYVSLDRDRREATITDSFSASEIQEDYVFLSLHLSFPAGWQTQELPFTVVTYFEDGFPYKVLNRTYTFNTGQSQASPSFHIGPGPGFTWIPVIWSSEGRQPGPETPTWAAGRHWVQVYHEGQKVAEVEFEVTP